MKRLMVRLRTKCWGTKIVCPDHNLHRMIYVDKSRTMSMAQGHIQYTVMMSVLLIMVLREKNKLFF